MKNGDVIYWDVFRRMGEEGEREKGVGEFKEYEVNDELMGDGGKDYIFVDCVGGEGGEEVRGEIIDGGE